ncbi:hypothetical protein [Gluconobacter sphaericus]|uniref:hypothetical protein n=1 Tax=Gluconobacter sphaericus TaxID=574987 RepID=UPI00312B9DB8
MSLSKKNAAATGASPKHPDKAIAPRLTRNSADVMLLGVKHMAEITGTEIGAICKKYIERIALGPAKTADDAAGFVAYLSSSDAD